MRYRVFTFLLLIWVGCLFSPLSLFSADGRKAVLTGDGLDLKERPEADSETIVTPGAGEAVLIILCLKDTDTVRGTAGHWCLVRYRGVEGWLLDTALNVKDPRAETSYRDVPSLSEEIDRLNKLRESGKLAETEGQCRLIIELIEQNFSPQAITESKRLSGALLNTFMDRIEALVYLHRFDEARAAYAYLMKEYPGIRLEDDFATAKELLDPYMAFMDSYPSAPLFSASDEPMKKIKAALEKRDLSAVSKLAVPGIFEIWVAHTDWVVRLGGRELERQEWLTGSWASPWEIREVSTKVNEAGDIVGYCIVTEPWSLNYHEVQVNRVDFCIDRLPDGNYTFSYLTLYTRPSQ
jgi:hypothetical protein